MQNVLARVVASPPLPPAALEEAAKALAFGGRLLSAAGDSDVNASCAEALLGPGGAGAAVAGVGAACGGFAAGRAFRFELFSDAAGAPSDEELRGWAIAAHGAFSGPVFVARRTRPAAAWALERPLPWGRKGLAVGQSAPMLPFGGSECLGVSIEAGAPTVLVKARLDGMPEHALARTCAAVGGSDSGFADVGAYAAVSAADGTPLVVLEFGDVRRSPIHRALTVLDIEAVRYGGRLGQVALLSHVPLDALLGVLWARTGLAATAAQVLETHLPPAPR